MPCDGDKNFIAVWEPLEVTITLNTNGGDSEGVATLCPTGNSYTLETTPTKANYTFTGWNTASDGSGTEYSNGDIILCQGQDLTLYAQWERTPYTVSYDTNGAPAPNFSQTCPWGTWFHVSSDIPEYPGYNFVAWYNTSGLNEVAPGTHLPCADATFQAVWVAAESTVTLDPNGGYTGTVTDVCTTGETYTLATTPSRGSHFFTGWNIAADGSGTAYNNGDEVDCQGEDITLYAQWQPRDVTLYDAASGSTKTEICGANYPNVHLPANWVTRAGYEFIGYNTENDGSGVNYPLDPTSDYIVASCEVGGQTYYTQWSADLADFTEVGGVFENPNVFVMTEDALAS